MPLRTFVKVGNISNLSDARYCAGMGVDMLGFQVIPGSDHYVSAKVFQEIRGWVTGPKIVAELYGITGLESIAAIIEQYAPDYFELTLEEYNKYGAALTLPLLIRTNESAHPAAAEYVVSNSADLYKGKKVLLEPTSVEQMLKAIEEKSIAGVVLRGTPEERPGFKDYSTLSEVLELLDEY